RIADWLMVHGVSFLSQHLTYSTIVGARKRDHPQSFDWRQPWWDEYTDLNDYHARVAYALTAGETHNRILVLNPTTSTYLMAPATAKHAQAAVEGIPAHAMLNLVQMLSDRQWDYDLGDEFIIERHGQSTAGE